MKYSLYYIDSKNKFKKVKIPVKEEFIFNPEIFVFNNTKYIVFITENKNKYNINLAYNSGVNWHIKLLHSSDYPITIVNSIMKNEKIYLTWNWHEKNRDNIKSIKPDGNAFFIINLLNLFSQSPMLWR